MQRFATELAEAVGSALNVLRGEEDEDESEDEDELDEGAEDDDFAGE